MALIAMAITLLLMPIASAVPTGLTYMDSTWSSYDSDDGNLVAINSNNTILASVHDDEVVIFDVETLDKIASFPFERVSAMEFSPDGKLLAINKGSSVQVRESLKLIEISSMTVLDRNALADDRAVDISWSPNGQYIAAPGPDGDVEFYRTTDLSVKDTLYGVHNMDVTCIDFRYDGEYILTGDESGRYAMWNSSGYLQGVAREFGEELLDCKFSPDGQDIILLDVEGNLMSRTITGSENHLTQIIGAQQILFSDISTRMHISCESASFKGLLTYDYQDFVEIKRTTFFHQIKDIAFIDDDFGRLQSLFVAAGTGQVAVYLRESIPEGFNQPGADLDGDSVPDNLDDDDDGDGIIDQWDDDIGCDAPNGIPCSRYPELSKIRSISIDIGDSFTISDSITLPTEYSSHIRNLSRSAIAADQKISSREAELFASAMCANIDQNDIIEQWRESISISNGELGEASINCILVSGLEMIREGDSTTQITLSIVTTFSYSSTISLPVDISLTEQPMPTDGSIAWLAPAHPIAISYTGDGAISQNIPLWWNNGDATAGVTLEKYIESEPTLLENVVSWAIHPIAFLLYFGILSMGALLFIRRENAIDIELEEEYEEDNLEDENVEEEEIESRETIIERTPPKRTPPTKKRTMYSTSAQSPITAKKRQVSAASDINKDGPIMKTKRKRLATEEVQKPVVTKRRAVLPVEKTVKTRKVRKVEVETVVLEDEIIPEIIETAVEEAAIEIVEEKSEEKVPEIVKEPVTKEKKKKRKPVRRKKKPSSEAKSLDEEKMQGDLVSDFLSKE